MRLTLKKPSNDRLNHWIIQASGDSVTYSDIGKTFNWSLSSFDDGAVSETSNGDWIQIRRGVVGSGEADFLSTAAAIKRGVPFDLGWVNCFQVKPMSEGKTLAVYARAMGIWATSFCRVVYVQQSEIESGRLFSVGLGTLPIHAAKGEERFSAYWNYETDQVEFLIGPFSQPQGRLTKGFQFYLRKQQKRFALESLARVEAELEMAAEGIRN